MWPRPDLYRDPLASAQLPRSRRLNVHRIYAPFALPNLFGFSDDANAMVNAPPDQSYATSLPAAPFAKDIHAEYLFKPPGAYPNAVSKMSMPPDPGTIPVPRRDIADFLDLWAMKFLRCLRSSIGHGVTPNSDEICAKFEISSLTAASIA